MTWTNPSWAEEDILMFNILLDLVTIAMEPEKPSSYSKIHLWFISYRVEVLTGLLFLLTNCLSATLAYFFVKRRSNGESIYSTFHSFLKNHYGNTDAGVQTCLDEQSSFETIENGKVFLKKQLFSQLSSFLISRSWKH